MGEVIKYFSILSAVILIATSCNGGGNKSNLESELDDVAMNVVEEATGDASLADYIVISKRSRSLKLYDSYNRLISRFTVAVGSGEGDKQFVGDMCTPEGEFVIEQIQSSADWLYDCGDGNGPTEGYYGNWFLRLSSPYKGIGIHGTSDIASLGTNSTNGSIHLANSDLDSLYNMVREGMKVRILAVDAEEYVGVVTEMQVDEPQAVITDKEPVATEEVVETAEDVETQKVETKVEAKQGSEVWHTVADGELLGRIVRNYGTTISEVKRLNPDLNVDRLSIGQRILISNGTAPAKVKDTVKSEEPKPVEAEGEVWYTLQPGDLVGRIAIRYGTTSKRIAELNPDINIDRVRDGQRIRVK